MSIICVDPRTDLGWQRLATDHKSDVFHSPAWLRVLAETYDWEAHAYLVLDDAGVPQAGIPFFRIADILGERIVSLPFSDYCDPLVDAPADWRCLVDRLLAEQRPIIVRCLHNALPLADEWFSVSKQAKWHGLDLRPDVDTLWESLNGSARRAIRKARGGGLAVHAAEDTAELRAFFDMHLRIRKYKYGMVAQPYRFFENIWHHFVDKQQGLLLLATHHDQIVGGIFFLAWKDRFYYKFNASVPSELSHRANDLLTWEGIAYAKAKGFTYLDFGLSDWDQAGLLQYKRKFASEEKAISFLRHRPDGSPSQQEQQGRNVLSQLTQLFVDETVPDQVTEKAGEVLYRFFT